MTRSIATAELILSYLQLGKKRNDTPMVRLHLLQIGEKLRAAQSALDGKPGEVPFQPGHCVPDGETFHPGLGKCLEDTFQLQRNSKQVISNRQIS